MIAIIDRYLIRMFLSFFLSGLIVFLLLFLVVDFMTNMARYNVETQALVKYYIFYFPGIAYQMFPVACLVGLVFTFGQLGKTNEMFGLFSLGMSLARISAPILVTVTVLSGLVFWMGDQILPSLTKQKNFIYYNDVRKSPGLYSTVKTSRIWYRSGNVLFNIKALEPGSQIAKQLTLYYFDSSWQLLQILQATEASIQGKEWILKNGVMTVFSREDETPLTSSFDQKTIFFQEDLRDISQTVRSMDVLSVKDQKKFVERNKEAGLDTRRYEVGYYSKFSFAMVAFVMCFLGIPFSVMRTRSRGMIMQVGLCLALVFGYWLFYNSSLNLGNYGYLPPIVAAWFPNIIALVIAWVLIIRLRR